MSLLSRMFADWDWYLDIIILSTYVHVHVFTFEKDLCEQMCKNI